MQILKSLLTFGFVLGVIGVVGLFITREVLLALTLSQVTEDFRGLEKQVSEGIYGGDCTRLGNFDGQGTAQLRFLDQRTYVLEVICGEIQSQPVLVKKQTLPLLAVKAYGDSGLTNNQVDYQLEFTVLGRSGVVNHVDSGELSWGYGHVPADQPLNGPPTSCSGYGLTCCKENEEQGHGRAIQGAVDCPKTCYEGCWARPVVLGFNTQPYYDQASRTLVTQTGQEVTFSYTISESQVDTFADTPLKEQKNPLNVLLAGVQQLFQPQTQAQPQNGAQTALEQVEIDFGDHQKAQLTGAQGTTAHTYLCDQPSCIFTATISAKNHQGAETQANRFNSVIVNVTQ